jgi:hypothetical protein
VSIDTRYEDALSRHLSEVERKKTPADKLRDRLAYAKELRAKAKRLEWFTEYLNRRIQKYSGERGEVRLKWRPFLHYWTLIAGGRSITLEQEEMEQIFTWMMDSKEKLAAHADHIENEVTKEKSA